ncbi:MAG: ABC transporter ATP-binding protein [Anaerolineales bacterium]|nr:ABC transporter ATP-binding protein [Anaerolineales bacterium]
MNKAVNETVAIQLQDLSKTFGRGEKSVQAVCNLNLEIGTGQVYGFLGPNGAGKTTTIRMIMTLIRPSHGRVYLYGQDVQQHSEVLKRVGALVEGPAFYGYLSGRENLEVLARTANNYHPQQITSLLQQVGLANGARREVGHYSLGMKQRLGIAAALLSDPELIIFDEPTNGLDPAGIKEMRQFIRSLASQQGKTVFLSSHMLNEVEQTCDRVAIIHQGQLVREGAVTDLLAEETKLRIQASPLDKALEVLQGYWGVSVSAEWLVVNAAAGDSPDIIKRLVEQNISVYQVVVERQSLEDYFMTVTKSGT